MEDNKKIELEEYCYRLLEVNNKSGIFEQIDVGIFIYDIKNTDLSSYLTDKILNKLKKIFIENNSHYIVGSFITQILFSSIEHIYNGNQITFINNDYGLIQNILNSEIENRILFDGNTIYFTIKWLNLYKNNKLINYSINNLNNEIMNSHICYQYYLIYNYTKKNSLEDINKNNYLYNQYDIEMINDEYILRYFFKNMDLSDDFHIRYFIYLFIIKPNILIDKYNDKHIIELLLEEYELKKDYIDNYNKIIAYIHTMNPTIFNSNLISYAKNNYEIYLMMQYTI
jgi:hypothetical protein